MSLTAGAGILASTWNAHVRAFTKKNVFSFSVKDIVNPFDDDDETKEGTFWSRNSGWNWPQFLAEHKTGVTYEENEEVALYATPIATEYIIAVRCNNAEGTSATPDPDHADWDLYRYEFGYQSVVIGDEVVYGGGLFTAITNADTTPPVIPKYADIANSDSNYSRSMTHNTSIDFVDGGFQYVFYIELKRPGMGDNIRVFSYSASSDTTKTCWLSPGEYFVHAEMEDISGLGTGKIDIKTNIYDDNVKQYEELRAFTSDLSELAAKGTTKLTASAMNTAPLCTGADIDDKGGTASLYTGDW